MEGWVKLHRKLLSSSIWENEKLLRVFMWCLLKASHKKHEQIVGMATVELSPGQFVTGRKKAAIELGMKESTVESHLKALEKLNIISMKTNNKFRVITIENWELYQSDEENDDNKITTNGQQNNTNKNGKNGKNNNIYAQQVEQLWSLYPNKKGKAKAIAKLPKLIQEYGYEAIESCIMAYANECKGKDIKYIKHGSTFFNGGFMDYLEDVKQEEVKGPYIDEETGEIIRR